MAFDDDNEQEKPMQAQMSKPVVRPTFTRARQWLGLGINGVGLVWAMAQLWPNGGLS